MKAKQVLGCLLSAAMVTSCLPGTAFAAGAANKPTDGGKEAVKADDTAGKIVSETTGTKENGIATCGAVKDDGIVTYKVYLPDGYSEDMSYPTVYLMPYDGYSADIYINDGIAETLDSIMNGEDAIPMVVVMPEFTETQDYDTLLGEVVADVEAKYSVIPDKQYRAILGVNVGGYMAYENALVAKSDLFYGVGSHMGDFISEANPYLEKGAITDNLPDSSVIRSGDYYYYIDAPNGDAATTVAGGTKDIGYKLEVNSGAYGALAERYRNYGGATSDLQYVEYAVLAGNADADYYLAALGRSMNRFSTRFTENIYDASLSCTPQAVTSDVKSAKAEVTLTMKEDIAKFAKEMPEVEVTVQMSDPDSGEILDTQTKNVKELAAGESTNIGFDLDTAKMADGINTTLTAEVSFMGMSHQAGNLSMVAVQDTGTADDEQQVDLMGDWYFKAYKPYSRNDASTVELDKVANLTEQEYTSWGVVQPCLGWWTADFDESLGGNANYSGYAWYVRTFDLPEEKDFKTEGLVVAVGCFDESNEVYINGKLIGSNGINFNDEGVGFYDGSNPWDVNNVYALDSSVLNYGGKNTIAIRTCNSSGGGGWYQGPVGIYTVAAYNKAAGKPSVYASDDIAGAVKEAAAAQQNALETENIEAYQNTLSVEYYESGYDRARRVVQASDWMNIYDNIKVTDTGVGVFVDGDLYNYQAARVITGEKDGETVEILNDPEVSEYYKVEDGQTIMYGSHSRFFQDDYVSEALDGTTQTFRVYLPEGYYEEGNAQRYPTLYLLHGINSQSTTYAIDKIDQVLDEAIAAGEIEPMIVVIPDDPTKSSFWGGKYADMVTDDLLPTVDKRYRTIDDERYRMTSGCSMGGGGSVNIGMFNSDLFSGVISFYGAIRMVENGYTAAAQTPDGYLNQFSVFLACGNQDMYAFYDDQELLSRVLTEKGVEHFHLIDVGAHDNIFYLPQFVPSLAYVTGHMYHTEDSAEILSGTADVNVTDKLEVTYNVAVGDKVSDYLNQVMALDGTVSTPDLSIPVEVVVTQNGVKVADVTDYQTAGAATTLTNTISIPTDDLDLNADYTVDVYATVLENTACIASTTVSSYQTGIYNVDGEDVYYVDGQRQYITDVVQVGNAWYNLVNGVVQKQVTVAGNAYGWWYINEDGIVDFNYTGLAPNTYGWWYVENGAVSFVANGLVYDSKYGWWYVERSAINFGYTGLVQNAYGWWYVEGGAINFQATGLVQNAYGWWYVENGAINFNYNSLAPNAYGWWKITGGQVDFGFTGYVNYGGVNYRVVNGQVQF